ncbi:MAG TPA: protein translocase subunit SecD [Spirochaetota bacterium]|mgnify:FL=1|nr:protein translocase subunit SecD [Spirochaetota bacterium]HOM88534.1 protein translocase subunit SecD [Spirochaetota bacterium]HOR94244.1 protein translocase subunit SecD [Spirochaetota bacterium]HOT19846.1 protein translocase subunit SecD [Spirochaetota bacterium]HPD05373.1 protein translocase subunit SecD [Spirochaetota bacterium]
MSRGLIYKGIFIVCIILFAIILILPTVGKNTLRVVMSTTATQEDIQAVKLRFPESNYTITARENEFFIEGYNLNVAVMNEVKQYHGVVDAQLLPHWAEKALLAKKINLGLDLQGGSYLVLQANYHKIEEKTGKPLTNTEKNEITEQALELLRNRVDKFGVAEPSIRPKGNDAIEIQLPGVKDPEAVKKAIGTTGQVEYRLVDDVYTQKANQWLKQYYAGKALPEEQLELNKLADTLSNAIALPDTLELMFYYERHPQTGKLFAAYPMVLEKKVALAGSDISKAWVATDEYQQLAVHFNTTPEGAAKFAEVTSEKNQGRKLAIVIDDKVRSAPSIRVQINTGQAIIQGDFTHEEVTALARIIKEGALPVDLSIVEERTVGPTLGLDSIQSGVKAFVVGVTGIMLFMFVYYKFSGLIADFGLLLNGIFMLALLSWLGFTLTLPGIAGFILTMGMAVDANVLIYERIKEELRAGKTPRMAVTQGFSRAFWTIFDSNITTLLSAFVLSQFGTGPIKGFAVTLSIGIICSMFVALYITRFIFEMITSRGTLQKLSI